MDMYNIYIGIHSRNYCATSCCFPTRQFNFIKYLDMLK